MGTSVITSRQSLLRQSSWNSNPVPVVLLGNRSTAAFSQGHASVRTTYYKPGTAAPIPLSIVADPRVHKVFLMRLGKDFYVYNGSKMFAGTVAGSQLIVSPSFVDKAYSSDDDPKLLTSSLSSISDKKISAGASSDNDFRIGLAKDLPPDFWSRNGLRSSRLGKPEVMGVANKDGQLELTLKSEGGKYIATFLIDLVSKSVVSVELNGKNNFRNITSQYP
jgi:hypothetical protein